MRKICTKYLLSILALLLCGCVENDVLIDYSAQKENKEKPIGFSGCFINNALTRHANELYEHLPSMGVWAWCTGMSGVSELVFDNQQVDYNADSLRWEYAPLKYWREACDYDFYAYAPHEVSQNDAQVSIDAQSRGISISGAHLYGHNLQDTPTDSVKELFRNTPDVDWMLARNGQHAVGEAGLKVEFIMQHLLSKLNISVKADEELLNRPCISGLSVDSVVVGALPAQGDFVQNATPQEWTAYDTTLYIKGTRACELGAKPMYVMESLVFPQEVSEDAMVTLYYTYHFSDNNHEHCCFRVPLSDAFAAFVSSRSYTIAFTISPKRIVFDTGVSHWEKYENL